MLIICFARAEQYLILTEYLKEMGSGDGIIGTPWYLYCMHPIFNSIMRIGE